MYHILFTHSSVNRHLVCFNVLDIVNNAAVNTGVHVSFTIAMGFPGGSAGKESACNAGDLGSITESGISPGKENSYPLHYSGLENSMDCIVHGITKSQTRLNDFHSHLLLHTKNILNLEPVTAMEETIVVIAE